MPTTTTMEPGNAGDIYLGEAGDYILLSPFGRSFRESTEEISREERTANGRLVREIIAEKKKFDITYKEINSEDVKELIELYQKHAPLRVHIYYADDEYSIYDVLMSPLDRSRILVVGDGLWGNVRVELREI